jgi:hypothetical protein
VLAKERLPKVKIQWKAYVNKKCSCSVDNCYYSAYVCQAEVMLLSEYRQYRSQRRKLTPLTRFDETQNAAVHLRTIKRAKASGHLLAILAFAQVAFTQVIVKSYCCVV